MSFINVLLVYVKITLYIFIVFGLMSCASQRGAPFQYMPEEEPYGEVGDEKLLLDIAYIGALGSNYIFQCAAEVIGQDAVIIDQSDFFLESKGQRAIPFDVQSEIDNINESSVVIDERRKKRTWFQVIANGLMAVLGIANGQPPAETILLTTENVAYTVDDNLRDKRFIESNEDYVSYLQEGLFDDDLIMPGQKVIRDVLFPVQELQDEVTFGLMVEGITYSVIFEGRHFPYED